MLANLLRSIFSRNHGAMQLTSHTAAVNPREVPVAPQLEAIGRRVDDIYKLLIRMDRAGTLTYQAQAMLLLEQLLAAREYDDPLRLERYGYTVYSQNEEDGILAEIFRRIGATNRQFLEFGVGNGLENNTLCLLEQGWSGAWIEGYPDHVSAIEHGFSGKIAARCLSLRHAVVDRDNIDELIRAFSLPRDLDLLSVDIDGNDYFVWEAITVIEPRVVVIEYNAKFRPPMRWVMRYDPTHCWDGSDQFGASLESLAELGRRKGYRLVGCNITGSNAFFVQSGLADGRFAEPADATALYQPARYFLTPAFVSGHPAGYSRAQTPKPPGSARTIIQMT